MAKSSDIQIDMIGRDISLGNLPAGSVFLYNHTLALKSEYRTIAGVPECHIIGSGEMFWGGTKTADELNRLIVTPILIRYEEGEND